MVANPHGMNFLMHDCPTVTHVVQRRGLDVDEGELFAHLVGFVCLSAGGPHGGLR